MQTIKREWLWCGIVLCAACVAGVPAVALAQTPAGTIGPAAGEAGSAGQAAVPGVPEVDLPPIEIPPEILEVLNSAASETAAAMADVENLLADNIEGIQNAEAIFDRMMQTIRDAAAKGAPDSEFVGKIEELAAMARTDAAAARDLGSMDQFAEWYAKQAVAFEEAKGEAISIYTGSFKKIREIEREKQRFLLAMKVKQYSLARQNISKGLDILRSLEAQIGAVYDKIPAPEAQPE